jgi:hypothetical protein
MQGGYLQFGLDGADIHTNYLRPNQYNSLPVTGVKLLRMNVQYRCFRMLVRCTRVISFQEIEIGLQYVPKSIAHIPVPVPTSRTRWTFLLSIGEVNSLPSSVSWNK